MVIRKAKMNMTEGGLVELSLVVDADPKILAETLRKAESEIYILDIKPQSRKRTLTANGYYQMLLDKLCSVLGASRTEIHEQLLADYGVTKQWADGRAMVIPLTLDQDAHSLGLHAQALNKGELNGKPCMWWRVLKGSSEMTTKEFNKLLDGIISECEALGIETGTKAEIERLKLENNNTISTKNEEEQQSNS